MRSLIESTYLMAILLGIGIGLAQTLAIIPGVSRSGSTLTAALFFGLKRETAARFSFLLGTPAILLAGLVSLVDVVGADSTVGIVPLLGGLSAAVVSSYLAIAWLIEFLKTTLPGYLFGIV